MTLFFWGGVNETIIRVELNHRWGWMEVGSSALVNKFTHRTTICMRMNDDECTEGKEGRKEGWTARLMSNLCPSEMWLRPFRHGPVPFHTACLDHVHPRAKECVSSRKWNLNLECWPTYPSISMRQAWTCHPESGTRMTWLAPKAMPALPHSQVLGSKKSKNMEEHGGAWRSNFTVGDWGQWSAWMIYRSTWGLLLLIKMRLQRW